MKDYQTKQKIQGCILGQAIGDAIGHPVEFNGSFGKRVNADFSRDNRFTDDTQMMAAIAEAILECPPTKGHSGFDKFMPVLGGHFASWYKAPLGGSHRAPGGACSSAARLLGAGTPWQNSGGLNAKGNGSAMRSSVVGCFYYDDLDFTWQVGCMTSIPTHNNLEAILCAGAVALLCACGIQGMPFSRAMAEVQDRIERFEDTVPMYPETVRIGSGYNDQNPWYTASHLARAYMMGREPRTEFLFFKTNGVDFATVPATAAAIYYNTRYSTFRDITLNCAANTADADTTTAIAGAIAGARFGYGFIPRVWRQQVEMSSYFHELADRVWAFSNKAAPDTDVAEPRTEIHG